MSVPPEAEKLQHKLNELARTIDESIDLASNENIESEAVLKALEDANDNIRTASEQLANVVGGL